MHKTASICPGSCVWLYDNVCYNLFCRGHDRCWTLRSFPDKIGFRRAFSNIEVARV